jgi:2-polyprenyl-3-methyl-5-hydroxy-6-metoxy-1,4-benzoquinol methylase
VDLGERLSEVDLARGDYLAASQVHRYALAAELCAGLRVLDLACGTGYGSEILAARAASVTGVDVDAASIALARHGRTGGGLTFVTADAVEHLQSIGSGDIDAIVVFKALEHLADPEAALDQLARLAGTGVRLAVSVPNSRAFRERNPFHITDFGFTEARDAFARLGDVTLLFQVLAEGSLILGGDARPDDFRGRVGALEQAEPQYANAFIALVGFDTGAIATATAELNLVATPNHNRYMLELERANAALFQTNRELGRGLYGKHDAAAASLVARYEESQRRVRELERHNAELERMLKQEWAWRDAARYRIVDRIAEAIKRAPIVYPLFRLMRRAARLIGGARSPRA